jgi:hypothetical protein
MINCNDGNACTADSCDWQAGCVHSYICAMNEEQSQEKMNSETEQVLCSSDDCNDWNACTIDSCDPEYGCMYSDIDCDDGNGCTDDGCDPVGGCYHDYFCNDLNEEQSQEKMNSETEQVLCSSDDCNDWNACTIDSCDPEYGCVSSDIDCDDGNDCTDDNCDPVGGCYNYYFCNDLNEEQTQEKMNSRTKENSNWNIFIVAVSIGGVATVVVGVVIVVILVRKLRGSQMNEFHSDLMIPLETTIQ